MAQYEHLPIYRAVYDFTLFVYGIVGGFSRQHRFGIGEDLLSICREAARKVVKANSLEEKLNVLMELRSDLEEIKLLLRLCKDLKAFHNFNSFETAFNRLIDICRQNEGWMRSLRGRADSGSEPDGDAAGYPSGSTNNDHRAAPPPRREKDSGRRTRGDRRPVGHPSGGMK